jgi:hypothetical protein
MVIAPLPMVQDLAEASGMAAPTDTVAGAAVGMQGGAPVGDILCIQLATHTHLAHHQQSMCSRF